MTDNKENAHQGEVEDEQDSLDNDQLKDYREELESLGSFPVRHVYMLLNNKVFLCLLLLRFAFIVTYILRVAKLIYFCLLLARSRAAGYSILNNEQLFSSTLNATG